VPDPFGTDVVLHGAVLGVVEHDQPVWTVNYLADGEVVSSVVEVTAVWS
jgi:hypothetical protein